MSCINSLEALQGCLEGAYDIRSSWRAADFVTATVSRGTPHGNLSDERVLVRHRKSGLDIALQLAPDLHRRLDSGAPLSPSDFALALEGVSHFLCIVWNAMHARQVSPVELELQAEVDKLLGLMSFQDGGGDSPGRLHAWLYSEGRLRAGLSATERERYLTANRLAARYWLALLRKYPAGIRDPALGSELRRFYRLSRDAKLRRAAERL